MGQQTRQRTCKQRWTKEKNSEIAMLRRLLWADRNEGTKRADRIHENEGYFNEHGLGFDYVAPGTFGDQREGYWRYQISWGGPSDEFRFYASDPNDRPYRIEYWFLDWFDGEGRALTGEDEELLLEIWDDFEGMGMTESEYEKAREEW